MPSPDASAPRRLAGAIGVGLLSSFVLFSRDPARVERWFVEGAGPRLTAIVAAPLSRVPLCIAEWIEGAAVAVAVGALVTVAVHAWRCPGRRLRVLGSGAATGLVALVWTAVGFYATWGLAYTRAAADVRMGFRERGQAPRDIGVDELARLATDFIGRSNRLYLELHGGWPDDLAPTTSDLSWVALDAAVDRGWTRMVPQLGLHPSVAAPRGPAKPLLSSGLFSWLGIGGFYFPFTGEANINVAAPAWGIPSTIGHEKAHQRFFASENEANYFGWLACVYSDDPFVRYSGWMFAHRQLLFALEDRDYRTFQWTIRQRLPGVQRDVTTARAWWAGYDGPLERMSDRVNDTYLRLNAVRGGVRSYSESLVLVVEHARHHPLPP